MQLFSVIFETGDDFGLDAHYMIDNICELGGLTEPERYSTCKYLKKKRVQKFLYQIYKPNSITVSVSVKGTNFKCSYSNYEPYLIVYIKTDKYFNGKNLWNGEFKKCKLIKNQDVCKYECMCGNFICKLVYLRWTYDGIDAVELLNIVSICDIKVESI